MRYILCIFSTSTTANRVKKMISNDLYRTTVMQAPNSIADCCAYALRIEERRLKQVMQICKENQFRVKGYYREVTSGRGQVVYDKI